MVKERIVTTGARVAPSLDIVTARDVLGLSKGASSVAKGAQSLTQAAQSVDNLSQWITIADKGISLLGKVEGILGRVESIGGLKKRQEGENRQSSDEKRPTYTGSINKENDAVAGMASVNPLSQPVQEGKSPMVDVNQIIQALEMVDTMQPGITCRQLADLIKAKPEEVGRIINAAMGGK